MKKEKLEAISNLVQERLGNDYVVAPETRTKNNNVAHYGVSIREKDDNIGTTFYVNDELQSWEVEEVADYVCRAYENIGPVDTEVRDIANVMFDKDEVLKRVKYAVINKEKNAERLLKVPHKELLDLAVVYKVYSNVEDGTATVTITNQLMQLLEIEYAELEAAAVVNSLQERVQVISLGELLMEIDDESMYVIRATESGAAVITHPVLFKQLSEKWNADFVLFPSSIHELIAYKVDCLNDEEAINSLKQMVTDINASEVSEEEVLSNNVYYYDKESGKLKIA